MMKKMIIVLLLLVLLLMMILVLEGCNDDLGYISTMTVDQTKTVTMTSTSFTFMITPSVTNTPTVIPPKTPEIPSLSREEAEELFLENLETYRDCEFPCWWGITPGRSKWDDIKTLLKPFSPWIIVCGRNPCISFSEYREDEDDFGVGLLSQYIFKDYEASNCGISLEIKNRTVYSINFCYPSDLEGGYLRNSLTQLPAPDEIWISYNKNDFNFGLFYYKDGVFIVYDGFVKVLDGISTGCIDLEKDIFILDLMSLDEPTTFSKLAKSHLLEPPLFSFKKFDEVTTVSYSDIFELLKKNEEEICIPININLWESP